MKKASLCIYLIVLVIYPGISLAQNSGFNLYFYNSKKQQNLEQKTDFLYTPFNYWQLYAGEKTTIDKRLDFNQTSRNSNMNVSLYTDHSYLKHNLQTGFEYLYDHSNLESELNPYLNKTGYLGYGISLNPVDSMTISTNGKAFYRKEQDRYRINHEFISKGVFEQFNARYLLGNQTNNFLLSGGLENKQMNWEAYQQISGLISANLESKALIMSTSVIASSRNEDLYVLENPDSTHINSNYQKYDRQYKRNLDTSINLMIPMGQSLNCEFSDQYSLHNYTHKNNQTRNTGDYNNLAMLKFIYQLTNNVQIQSSNSYNYYLKDLSYVDNSRIIDVRYTSNGIAWEYNKYDSLTADYTVELRRTDYPDSDHKLDNDYLNKILKLGWTIFLKDRMRISNHALYTTKDEVFLDAGISANNNTVTGYQWQTGCDILAGDCFLLQQEYQIRADYDDYYYNTFSGINDTFYRQIKATYQLVYDSTPLLSKLIIPKWNLLSYRSRSNESLRMDLKYSWEKNETSAKDGDIYLINGVVERQILSCVVQKQYGIGIFQLMPKYTWGNWKEYSLLISAIWQLNSNSLAEININPLGESISDLDWRISCSVNLQF